VSCAKQQQLHTTGHQQNQQQQLLAAAEVLTALLKALHRCGIKEFCASTYINEKAVL
jgi:hypothetical protein